MSTERESEAQDPGLAEIRSVLEDADLAGDPLLPRYRSLAVRYTKMFRSFMKTLRISDRYQLRLKELNENLDEAMRTDYLTGLLNRRAFFDRSSAELSRARRHGRSICAIMADIDEFKNVNDRYGHAAGDEVLRTMARLILSCFRHEDICVRWGGEEFLIVLPDTDILGAAVAAEKLRSLVASTATMYDNHAIRVTISAGSAENRGEEIDLTIKNADEALLEAKALGRDRSVARSPKV
ncbi:MAG TPA: diguanylate cyclase [Rectinemataceae bacterium]|nr:diguanylate cyclase [Rectinemataceae bacterium]